MLEHYFHLHYMLTIGGLHIYRCRGRSDVNPFMTAGQPTRVNIKIKHTVITLTIGLGPYNCKLFYLILILGPYELLIV